MVVQSLSNLSAKLKKVRSTLKTEEATKNSLIMPFIQALGYNVFNPLEVVPEYVADIGIKKGEKIDYAILKDEKVCILMECKPIGDKLDQHNSQLFRYFHASSARFAILTNGDEYRFYTDLAEPNKMDTKPFFTFFLHSVSERDSEELKKFHKSYFDIEAICNTASDLKYIHEIKNILHSELESPSEDFVRYFASQVYDGRLTAKVLEGFSIIVKKTFLDFVKEKVDERIKSALSSEDSQDSEEETLSVKKKIVTTDEEIEAYMIVRAILYKKIDIEKVTHRDVESYFGILFDDNNRKPICRLILDGSKKYIILFDEKKEQRKKSIESLSDIYQYSKELLQIAEHYESGS